MKLGRTAKRVFWISGALAILFVLFHTGPVKEGARRLVASALGRLVQGEASIEGLDYRLWRGEVELDGLAADPEDGAFRVSVAHARLRVTGLPKVSLELVRPELQVLRLPAGGTAGGAPLAVLAYLGAARIERGAFVLLDVLRVDDLEANLLESPQGHRLALHAAQGRLEVSGEDVPLGPLDADAVLTPETIHIVSASLFKEGSFLRAEGEIALAGGLGADLLFDANLEASLARHVNGALELRGVLGATGRARFEAGRPRVEAAIRSQEMGWREIALQDLAGRVELEGSRLRLRDVASRLYGGQARLDASLDLVDSGGERSLDASWEDVDPNAFYLALTGDELPLASRASGELHATLGDWSLETASGSSELRWSPVVATKLPSLTGQIDAAFDAGVVAVRTEALALSRPRTTAEIEGQLEVDGELDLRVSATLEPSSIEELPFAAEGFITADGRLAGKLPAPTWSARISSRDLRWTGEPFELSGSLRGDTANAVVEALSLEGRGGSVEAEGVVPLDSGGQWSLEVVASELGLPTLGPLSAVVAEADLRVEGAADAPNATAAMRLEPLSFHGREGEARLSLRKVGETLTLDELHAAVAGGTLDASGSYALDSEAIEAKLALESLELEGLVEGLTGKATMDLAIGGSRAFPTGTATLRVGELALKGEALPEAVVEARTVGGDVALLGRLDGKEVVEGSLALAAPFPLHLEATLSELPWDELGRASHLGILSVWSFRAAGTASLDAELDAPRELQYRASVDELVLTTAVSTATSSPFLVEGDLERLSVQGLDLEGPQGRVSLDGHVPLTEAGELDVRIDARLPLENLQGLSPDLEVGGDTIVDVRLTGPLSEPRVDGNVDVAESEGRFQKLYWSDVSLSARASRDRLDRVELRGNLLDGHVEIEGELPLRSGAAPGSLEVTLEGLDLASLLRDEEREDLAVLVSFAGALDVTEPSLSGLSGSGELGELSLRSQGQNIDLSAPVSWRLGADGLELSPATLRGDGTELSIGLRALDLALEPRIEASLTGGIDLALVDDLLANLPELSSEGRGELAIDVAYSRAGLALRGSGAVSGGRLTLTEPRFALSNLAAELELEGSRVTVSTFTASAGPGRLTGGGFIDLDPEAFGVDLSAEARGVPLELMDGLRVETSGTIGLASADDALRLSGNLSLDRGLLTREVDDEDMGFSSRSVAIRDPTAPPGIADRLSLDVTITTRRNLVVENSMAQIELAGNLSLGGTLAEPEVEGIVTVLPDGNVRVGRNAFQVRQGRVDLRGFPLTPPRLDLIAVTRVGQTLIQIELEGDTDDLRTRLTAPDDPNLSEGDLASLLVTGRTLEEAGQGGQQIASTWMMSSLANLFHQGLGDLISYGPPPGAGPLILAEEADPTSRLTLGVPVTQRLSATYSIALNDAESRLWILDYRVARNIWLRGIQENASDYSVGVTQRFDIDVRGSQRGGRLDSESAATVERLAEISLHGAPEGLEWKPGLRAGDRYDYWAAQDEARRLTAMLVEKGYPSATVEVRTETDADRRLGLIFEIRAGKPTSFVWSGDDPGKDLRQSVERAWDGRIPETFLLPDLAERARTSLAARRYYLARVDARVEDAGERRRVVFDIDRGPRGDHMEIRFEGNEALDQETLRAILPGADQRQLYLLLRRPAELARGIRLRYASEGYLDASLGDVAETWDPKTGTFRVVVPIDEGTITRVRSVAFEGSTALDVQELGDAIGVAVGDPVAFPEIRRGEARIRTIYREEGFPDVRLRTLLSRTVEGLEIAIAVEEGARARVGDIRVVGNVRTRASVIRGQLTFAEGDPLRVTDFQESQKRLYDLGILRTADVRVDPAQQGQPRQDVLVEVGERPDLDVAYGIRYNVLTSEQSLETEVESKGESVEGVARVNVVNPFGFGASLGLSVFFQKEYQLYRGTLRLPTLFGRRVITEVIVDTERETDRLDIPGLELRRDSLTFQQTKKLRDLRYDKLALQWNVSYARYGGQSVDRESGRVIEIDTNRPRLGISFIDDRRDSFANPTRGRFWNVNLQYTPEIWGSDVSYSRVYGQFFYYYPIGRLVWASGLRLGFAPGERPFLLIDDRFQAGGANSVRGFAQNALGPSVTVPATGERIYIGGQAVGVFNQELRFPLYKSLHGGVFWDVGNVFARASDFRIPDLRQSLGAGLRYVLSFGAIRLDWARVLDPREGESSSRLHFSFGYAF